MAKKSSTTVTAGFRTEKDTMGEMQVPAAALYGASTQRAVLNFPVSGRPVPPAIISAYAILKAACATVNNKLKRLDTPRTKLITEACREIRDGLTAFKSAETHDPIAFHFPIDIFQTGSGTSTNMNVNEVVANIVCLRRGKPIGSSKISMKSRPAESIPTIMSTWGSPATTPSPPPCTSPPRS
jgi:fumarate hydratase class II